MQAPPVPWLTDARAAWLDGVAQWVTVSLGSLGLGPPSVVTPIRERPWGAVCRVEVPGRVLFFKAEGPGALHEPVIVSDIAHRWPGLVPDLLAADLDRSWLLMDDNGTPMWDSVDVPGQVAIFEQIVPRYAEMQRGSLPMVERWIGAGTPDRRVHRIPELVDQLLAGELWRDALPIGPDERRAIDAAIPVLAAVCDEVATSPFADGLDHSDMHGGNILVGRSGGPRLVDWGDSTITHPFASLFVTYQHAVAKLPADDRPTAARRLRDVYLEAWSDDASPDELRGAFAQAIWLGHVIRALNFAHQLDDTGPDAATESRAIARFLLRWQHHAQLLGRPDELIEAVASETEE